MLSNLNVTSAIAWKIRPFRPSDASTISETLDGSSEAARWPSDSYAKLASSVGGLLLVCEANTKLIGFLAARQIADEGEILNIAVRPDSRRRGVASALLLATLGEFQRSSIVRVFLELRESNLPARSLYERYGFVSSGRRKSYYANPTEDAVCMLKKLTDAPD
jgi:ribosomal-protein-alanine N-acetyltransferase